MFRVCFAILLFCFDCFSCNQYISKYVDYLTSISQEDAFSFLDGCSDGENPNSDCAFILSNFYLSGVGCEKNIDQARKYLYISAGLGNVLAMNSIGDGYYSGDIYDKNIKMALQYYEKAANLGYGPGQFNAGIVLLRHFGDRKDCLKRACFWLEMAAKNTKDLCETMRNSALRYAKDAKTKLEN